MSSLIYCSLLVAAHYGYFDDNPRTGSRGLRRVVVAGVILTSVVIASPVMWGFWSQAEHNVRRGTA